MENSKVIDDIDELLGNNSIITNNVNYLDKEINGLKGDYLEFLCNINYKNGRIGNNEKDVILVYVDRKRKDVGIDKNDSKKFAGEAAEKKFWNSVEILMDYRLNWGNNSNIVMHNFNILRKISSVEEIEYIKKVNLGVNINNGRFVDLQKGVLLQVEFYEPTKMIRLKKENIRNLYSKLTENAKTNLNNTLETFKIYFNNFK